MSVYTYTPARIPKPHKFKDHPAVKFVEAPLLDISATYLRACLKNGKSIRYMVSEPVEQMIRIKKFYA